MYLPLYFKTEFMDCLVIGGGDVAYRKIQVLHDAGCKVLVISPEISPEVSRLVDESKIAYIRRRYQYGDCMGNQLVIVATGDPVVDKQVSDEARALGIPVNVVDVPNLCSVIFPAVERDEPLVVAVSTGGIAPFMAAELRNKLRNVVAGWSTWVSIAGKFREIVKRDVKNQIERNRLYRKFLSAGLPPEDYNPPEIEELGIWLAWLENMPGRNGDE